MSEQIDITTVTDANIRQTRNACRQIGSSSQPQPSIVNNHEKHTITSTGRSLQHIHKIHQKYWHCMYQDIYKLMP